MIHRVREDDAAGEFGTECGEAGVVGDVAGREDEGGGLAVESGKLVLEGEMESTVTGDVSGTASTGTVAVKCAPGRQL